LFQQPQVLCISSFLSGIDTLSLLSSPLSLKILFSLKIKIEVSVKVSKWTNQYRAFLLSLYDRSFNSLLSSTKPSVQSRFDCRSFDLLAKFFVWREH
jgi:hypothetical protein